MPACWIPSPDGPPREFFLNPRDQAAVITPHGRRLMPAAVCLFILLRIFFLLLILFLRLVFLPFNFHFGRNRSGSTTIINLDVASLPLRLEVPLLPFRLAVVRRARFTPCD